MENRVRYPLHWKVNPSPTYRFFQYRSNSAKTNQSWVLTWTPNYITIPVYLNSCWAWIAKYSVGINIVDVHYEHQYVLVLQEMHVLVSWHLKKLTSNTTNIIQIKQLKQNKKLETQFSHRGVENHVLKLRQTQSVYRSFSGQIKLKSMFGVCLGYYPKAFKHACNNNFIWKLTQFWQECFKNKP